MTEFRTVGLLVEHDKVGDILLWDLSRCRAFMLTVLAVLGQFEKQKKKGSSFLLL
jgi:hypothetical protein